MFVILVLGQFCFGFMSVEFKTSSYNMKPWRRFWWPIRRTKEEKKQHLPLILNQQEKQSTPNKINEVNLSIKRLWKGNSPCKFDGITRKVNLNQRRNPRSEAGTQKGWQTCTEQGKKLQEQQETKLWFWQPVCGRAQKNCAQVHSCFRRQFQSFSLQMMMNCAV